jgi:hypothetical protein
MVAVGMVQVAIDQIIDMVAVRHGLVAATGAVPVVLRMLAAIVSGRAALRIGGAHGDGVLVEMIFVGVMKMAVMKIVDVALVSDRRMTATRTVLVRMVAMDVVRCHLKLLSM